MFLTMKRERELTRGRIHDRAQLPRETALLGFREYFDNEASSQRGEWGARIPNRVSSIGSSLLKRESGTSLGIGGSLGISAKSERRLMFFLAPV